MLYKKLFTYVDTPGTILLLAHMEGTNNSSVFTDDGPGNHTIETYGDVKISSTQSKFGNTSAYFNEIGNNFLISAHSDFNFLTTHFTIDCWIYPTQNATLGNTSAIFHIVNSNNTLHGLHIHRNAGGYLCIDNGLYGTQPGNIQIPLNTWSHIAIVRYNYTIMGFVNGVMSSSAQVQDYPLADKIQFGRYHVGNTTSDFRGYIDEIRIVKDKAMYTSNFTPKTTQYEIT